MKALKISLFLTLAILPSQGNCQDSTLVSVPRWQVSRLIHEVKLGRSCDSLRQQLEAELLLAYRVEAFADSLLAVRDHQIKLATEVARISEVRRLNREEEVGELKKEVKKWRLISIATVVISVLIIL